MGAEAARRKEWGHRRLVGTGAGTGGLLERVRAQAARAQINEVKEKIHDVTSVFLQFIPPFAILVLFLSLLDYNFVYLKLVFL